MKVLIPVAAAVMVALMTLWFLASLMAQAAPLMEVLQ